MLMGELERIKLGPLIESDRFVVSVRVPEVPVMVRILLVVAGAVLLTVSVRVLVPLVEAGEKAAVTPVGRPETESFTVLVNPNIGMTEIVDVPVAP